MAPFQAELKTQRLGWAEGERRARLTLCSPCSRDVGVKAAWWWVSGKVSSVQILFSFSRQDHHKRAFFPMSAISCSFAQTCRPTERQGLQSPDLEKCRK